MRSPLRITAVLLVAAVVMGACASSGSSDSGLGDTVRAQGEAQDALRVRVGDIEDQISAVLSRDDITDFRTMQDTVASLQTRLDELAAALDAAGVAAEDRTATVDATLGQLTSDVQALTAAVAQLDAELQQLREDHESLQVQFQTHRTDDSRHQ
jgi:peptidoglycan hydrolase CwlO-like protein